MPGPLDIALWGVFPYLVFSVLIGGLIWRYRYDQFGWTTRSSQLYESRLLRVASPLFHFGLLAVVGGHVIGLIIPESWTTAVGVTDHAYHIVALATGGAAGLAVLIGIALLIWRRRTTGPVFMATSNNDKLMYVVLAGAIVAGLAVTLISVFDRSIVNYRETVSVWFRSIWILQPNVAAMAAASLPFKIHAVWGMVLFAIWPFTRLVHAFTAPFHYLFRPYIVYRSRDARERGQLSGVPRRGWEPVGTRDAARRAAAQQERKRNRAS